MRLGLMNHPARDVNKEISRIAGLGFGFVDLTLEPPKTRPEQVDARKISFALEQHGLGVIGHTAYYLPFASAFDSIQAAAIAEAEKCLHVFADVGAKWMNLHLDCRVPGYDPDYINRRNVAAISALLPASERLGVGLMVENTDGDDGETLAPVLDALPTVGLHLDVGHANLGTRKSNTVSLLARYGDRLRHVHLSDNKGKNDDHLAIGAGTIDWKRELKAIKSSGYDGFLTLETFYGDHALLTYGRDKVAALWAAL